MPFKMIASRHVYRVDDGKEYKKGETFMVNTEKDRDRLIRNKRARLDDSSKETAVRAAPVRRVEPDIVRRPVVQKVMTSEDAPASNTEDLPKPNRYRRSDLRAED